MDPFHFDADPFREIVDPTQDPALDLIKEISIFFLIFFNPKSITKNWDLFWLFMSLFMYIKQKSELFF